METKPPRAVTIIEARSDRRSFPSAPDPSAQTDCEVDFAPPLDYVEPVPQPKPTPAAAAVAKPAAGALKSCWTINCLCSSASTRVQHQCPSLHPSRPSSRPSRALPSDWYESVVLCRARSVSDRSHSRCAGWQGGGAHPHPCAGGRTRRSGHV